MSAITQLIGSLRNERLLSALDEQLGRSLCALAGETSEEVWLAIALLSRHIAAGHVCLPLSELAKPELLLGTELPEVSAAWPQQAVWTAALKHSRLCDPREPVDPGSR